MVFLTMGLPYDLDSAGPVDKSINFSTNKENILDVPFGDTTNYLLP